MRQLTIEDARAAADDGIRRAAEHAEREAEGWSARADGYLREYLAGKQRGDHFLAEAFREFAILKGMDEPPDGRAWGHVMQSGARAKLIVKDGYAPARSSNLSPKVRWRVL